MKAYEMLLLLDSAQDEEAREAVLERVRGLITAEGGVVDNVDSWGKRRLAFEINDATEGEYVLVDFHHTPEAIAEIDRVLHITDPVFRYMLLRRDDRQ
ncbi:MAG TPA: 30S ribosomal protein S6 [Coriobacteriia bacterium]|nr:30S ribosomal protein S6 [Coriobacteriia bacterium]